MDFLSAITTPIPGDCPTGADINYDPDFDALKAEVGKLGNIDDELIERHGRTILQSKSKDLRVLAFLSFAFLRKGNWASFADVFDGLVRLAEEHFDQLHPLRPRARENAFRWLSENRFTDTLEGVKPAEADYKEIARLVEALSKLRPLLEQKFPETAPFPQRLFSAAQKWERETKPKPVEAPAPGAGPAQAKPAAAGGQAEPMETPKQAQTLVRKAALFLIEQEPQKAMGYRLLRSSRWDLLEKAPPAADGRTQIPAPQQQQRDFFQGLLSSQEWLKALIGAQKAFASGGNHCWLDLQRISASACEALGEQWATVREAVEDETALMVRRIPEITTLSFTDGSPFCDEATRDWVEGLGGRFDQAAGGSAAGDTPAQDPLDEERKAANALVGSGKIEEALETVQQAICSSRNERDRFRRSLMLGGLLLGAGRTDMALGILDALGSKIEELGVDSWDPELAVEAWRMTYEACGKMAGKGEGPAQTALRTRRQEVLRRISRVDPKTAFNLST